MGAPVPFEFGRPAPSWIVNLALKSWAPYWINCTIGAVNSSPSWRCLGMATSRPTCEFGFWAKATIATRNGVRKGSHRQVCRKALLMGPSFLSSEHRKTHLLERHRREAQFSFISFGLFLARPLARKQAKFLSVELTTSRGAGHRPLPTVTILPFAATPHRRLRRPFEFNAGNELPSGQQRRQPPCYSQL
jgi:hypothetical protein